MNRNALGLFSLTGKVALITGGRAMYGKSCSVALADAGASLYVASTNLAAAEAFCEELQSRGGKAYALEYHQEDPESIRSVVNAVINKEGRIDVFVNASRVIPKGGAGWFQEEEGLAWAVQVNSAGMLYITTLVGEQMIRQKGGSLFNYGSHMGLVGVEKPN